jgi:hypothetical protein
VDHNPTLLERVQTAIPYVVSVDNLEAKGLSGARNSGIAAATGPVIAFLDDDGVAAPDWLEHLLRAYANPEVMGVGGTVEPLWLHGRPPWFPAEFDWVVGCTYRGLPAVAAPVRNLIGCNMSVRRDVLEAAGGFRNSFGCNHDNTGKSVSRTALPWLKHHAGDEETEFCIRVQQQRPDGAWLYTPSATVRHRVPAQRARWRYFLWRCYDEGLGKAMLVEIDGPQAGLSSERTYTLRTLPRGVVRALRDAVVHADVSGLGRAIAIASGFTVTAAGYAIGRLCGRLERVRGRPSLRGLGTDKVQWHIGCVAYHIN